MLSPYPKSVRHVNSSGVVVLGTERLMPSKFVYHHYQLWGTLPRRPDPGEYLRIIHMAIRVMLLDSLSPSLGTYARLGRCEVIVP